MYPPLWSFLAVLLLIAGLFEVAIAPRRRVARLLHMADELRDGRAPVQTGWPRRLMRWALRRTQPWLPSTVIGTLRDELLWAGQPMGLSAEEFLMAKLCIAVATSVLMLGATQRMPVALLGIALGLLVPDRWLARRIADRTEQIRRDLSAFVHLFATALEAGLPTVEAARRVAVEMPGLLAAEVMRTTQEMAAGKPAAQAWADLGGRTKCEELSGVVIAIVQAQEMGVPVADQLRFQLAAMRTKKQQEAKERADAASVQMRVPTIVFIMIPTMVILMGPAVITVLRSIRGL